MKFQNLFLFLLLLSVPLSHCMEEKEKHFPADSIDAIATAIEAINLNGETLPTKPTNDLKLSQKEIQQIVSILALREKVTKLLYQRCSMNLSVRIVAKNESNELSTSKKAVIRAFQAAEIAYSLANSKTQAIIDVFEKEALKKSNNTTASYTALKVGLNLWVLADETNDTDQWFKNLTDVFNKHQKFFENYLSDDALCYKSNLSKEYQKHLQKLTIKPYATPTSIYSLDTCIYKGSNEIKLILFRFFIIIHTLVLKDLAIDEISILKNTKSDVKRSAQYIRLKNKVYQKKINLLNAPKTKTIEQTINDFLQESNLDNNLKNDLLSLLDLNRIKDSQPAYYKYLDYLKGIFSSFPISKIIIPHTNPKIKKIVSDNEFMNDLIFGVLNQLQKKPNKDSEAKKLPQSSKKRRKRRKKRKKQTLDEEYTVSVHETKKASQSNAQKRRMRRRKQKEDLAAKTKIKDDESSNLKQPITPATLDKKFLINAKEDILHHKTDKYFCILDLKRVNQNKIFIPKDPSPLTYNPLAHITYSQYVINKKMSRENDNNHAFSPLVKQFGQNGYIVDQELTTIQKKALGTKHHIPNSTQYTLQHTVYLPARIASLGYPIAHFENNGCTTNGEFEFTFVRKNKSDLGICIHRLFRPYN